MSSGLGVTCDALSQLLLQPPDSVGSMPFSPDSGVSSSSDNSKPSSPTLLTSYIDGEVPFFHDSSASSIGDMTQLTNVADRFNTGQLKDYLNTCAQVTGELQSECNWSQHFLQSVLFPAEEGWTSQPCTTTNFLSTGSRDCGTTQHSTVETEHIFLEEASSTLDQGNEKWDTNLQVWHTGDGTADVKLARGLTYDITLNIDIPDILPTSRIKREPCKPENGCGHHIGHSINQYDFTDTPNYNVPVVFNNSTFNGYPDTDFSSLPTTAPPCESMVHCPSYSDSDDCNNNNIHPRPHGGCPVDRGYAGRRRPSVTRTERLWEFILRLLGETKHNPSLIEWVDRDDGTFRLNNSKAIAYMWGMRKNNQQMTYEKLSRALRYYYHRHILEPVLGKKLVYRFGPNALQVWEHSVYRPQGPR